jgi:hypothetical protein
MSTRKRKWIPSCLYTINPIFLGVFIVTFIALNLTEPGGSGSNLFWGGIAFQADPNSLDLIGLGRWMLFVSPYILFACVLSEQELNKMGPYVIPRYHSYTRWWRSKVLSLMIGCLVYLALGMIETMIHLDFSSQSLQEIGLSSLGVSLCLTSLHLYLISLLILAGNTLYSNQHVIALGALSIEGITLLPAMMHAKASRFMFGTWGMLYRSNLVNQTFGFPIIAILLVQAILCAILIVGMPCVLKRRGVFSTLRV